MLHMIETIDSRDLMIPFNKVFRNQSAGLLKKIVQEIYTEEGAYCGVLLGSIATDT